MNARTAKYLVCMDHREEARVALRLACMKAQARNGAVHMIHAVPPADFQTLGAIADRMREERLSEGKTLLAQAVDEAIRDHGITPSSSLREGPAGDEIIAAAQEDADIIMVVLGIATGQSAGRGKLASWLASQLGIKLFTPLLMVPGNLTDEQLRSLI